MLWAIAIVLAIVVIIPVALYIPAVQNLAKDIAVKEVKKSSGLDISIDYLRLRFPLTLVVDGAIVREASGDTMVHASKVNLDLAFLPLLRGNLDVKEASLSDVMYRMGNPDSAMQLTARINSFTTRSTSSNLSFSDIAVGTTVLDGADVVLLMKDTVTESRSDTAASKPMRISAPDIELRNIRFRMAMLPVIDSMDVTVPLARLADGMIDMGLKKITASSLTVDSVTATYLTPSAEFLKTYRPRTDSTRVDSSATTPADAWTITAGHLGLTGRHALYAMRGAQPVPGFDVNYIEATGIDLSVDSFYNRGVEITVPLRHLAARERSGLSIQGSGTFAMDSSAMEARDFKLSTVFSHLDFNGRMGMGDLVRDPSLPLRLDADGTIGLADVEMFMPSLSPMLRSVPRTSDINLRARVHGTSGSLDIDTVSASMHRYLSVLASGHIDNPMDFNRMNGRVDIDGTLTDVNFIKPTLLEAKMAREVNIPPTRIKGRINYSPGLVDGKVAVITGQGNMALDGRWQQKAKGYDATIDIRNFPVASFMPSLGVGNVTLTAQAKGHGYDVFSPATSLTAAVNLGSAVYNGEELRNVSVNARLDKSMLNADILSRNPALDMDATLSCDLAQGDYRWQLDGDVQHIDLQAFHLADNTMFGAMQLDSDGSFDPRTGFIDARATLNRLDWTLGDDRITAPEITASLKADSATTAQLSTGDLTADFQAQCSLDSLTRSFAISSDILNKSLASFRIDIDTLQSTLPQMQLNMNMGSDNFVARYLASSKISLKSARLTLSNDSLISFSSHVLGLTSGSVRTDTITFSGRQRGRYLLYTLAMNNRKGTFDDFAHVNLNGFIGGDRLAAMIDQRNISDRQGFRIGLTSVMKPDSSLVVKLVPRAPVIAYKKWSLNSDNFISFNFPHKHLDANLELKCDSSMLSLRTAHAEASDTLGLHDMNSQDDVRIRLANINLADWLSISPFAPPIKGVLGADMLVHWDPRHISEFTGNGNIDLNDLYYGRDRVGSFTLRTDVRTGNRGLHANVDLLVDSVKVITANGVLNDSTLATPFLLDFSMIRFPLRTVNPFLPKDVAQLRGVLNGQMKITGDMASPVFNGFIDFDSTAVKVGMTGASYPFSEEKVPVDSNVVRFSNFTIGGLNGHDLALNGTVDIRRLTNVIIDLTAKASDMQIVNSSRPRGASVYGKAFVALDASVKGNMNFLDVDARLNILPGTNVTYVMTGATDSRIVSRNESSMVRFVQFSDTTQVQEADTIVKPQMMMNLDAALTVSSGSTINVDISPDGKNKASIEGEGTLNYTMTPMSDGRIVGRFNINKGFVRYSPPFMSEKNFTFQEGSYIAFNGPMLNPVLNIKAVDRLKANVTQQGQNSRLVNFDIALSVTNTLQDMNVAFDLSTNDDLTIENELSSMSPQQRANQAMNMLLYNVYTGPGTKGNANLSGNQLFSFLESQINSWAANNIKGVDISFGIDQYDKTTDGSSSTTISYSYRVSKSLFNDRIKIVVGGNYSTDADADENFSQNLINDISFEYMLNRSGSMYVRLFRHVGYESILEGEITQTGVGFVLRRKINSFRDIFRLRRPPRQLPPLEKTVAADSAGTSVVPNEIDKK